MNFWEDKNEFWKNKTTDNPIYARQKLEIAEDLVGIMSENGWKSILDVGGYDGAMREYLPSKYRNHYKSIDYKTNFELQKNWKSQGLSKKYDVVMTSLTLIAIAPDKLHSVLDQIYFYAKHLVYIFEEHPENKPHGYQVNNDYGGKWTVTLSHLISGHEHEFAQQSIQQSKTNPAWIKYIFLRKPQTTLL